MAIWKDADAEETSPKPADGRYPHRRLGPAERCQDVALQLAEAARRFAGDGGPDLFGPHVRGVERRSYTGLQRAPRLVADGHPGAYGEDLGQRRTFLADAPGGLDEQHGRALTERDVGGLGPAAVPLQPVPGGRELLGGTAQNRVGPPRGEQPCGVVDRQQAGRAAAA